MSHPVLRMSFSLRPVSPRTTFSSSSPCISPLFVSKHRMLPAARAIQHPISHQLIMASALPMYMTYGCGLWAAVAGHQRLNAQPLAVVRQPSADHDSRVAY